MHALFLGSTHPASLSLHLFLLSPCQLGVAGLFPTQALPASLHPCSLSATVARWSCWTVPRNSLETRPALPRGQSLFTAAVGSPWAGWPVMDLWLLPSLSCFRVLLESCVDVPHHVLYSNFLDQSYYLYYLNLIFFSKVITY